MPSLLHPPLRFAGMQAYWGNLQQVMPLAEPAQQAARLRRCGALTIAGLPPNLTGGARPLHRSTLGLFTDFSRSPSSHSGAVPSAPVRAARLRRLVALLTAGLPPEIVTGGGTGTSFIDPTLGLFTELQPGSFLFLDSCYGAVPLVDDGNPFTPALFVAATVVSAGDRHRAIVNAGLKALATDSGRPVPMRGAPEGATYRFMGDEHGAVEFDSGPPPALGSTIELLTSHCDPTVNLHARYQVVRGSTVVDTWPIAARGY